MIRRHILENQGWGKLNHNNWGKLSHHITDKIMYLLAMQRLFSKLSWILNFRVTPNIIVKRIEIVLSIHRLLKKTSGYTRLSLKQRIFPPDMKKDLANHVKLLPDMFHGLSVGRYCLLAYEFVKIYTINTYCHNRLPLCISQHVINLFFATKFVSFVVSSFS